MAKHGGAVAALDQLAATTIVQLVRTQRVCWGSACQHEGIDPALPFVEFSATNPYAAYYERISRKVAEAISNNQVLGYVGLRSDRREIPRAKKPRARK